MGVVMIKFRAFHAAAALATMVVAGCFASSASAAPFNLFQMPLDQQAAQSMQAPADEGELSEAPARFKRQVVDYRTAEPAGTGVAFVVTDQGPGIPIEERERVFAPFYRIDKARSRESGGTGLGLAISKRLVEMMGGSIGIDSDLGKGSTFWFEIPFEHARDADELVAVPFGKAHEVRQQQALNTELESKGAVEVNVSREGLA